MIPTNTELRHRFIDALAHCPDPLPRTLAKDALRALLLLEGCARAQESGPACVHYLPREERTGEDALADIAEADRIYQEQQRRRDRYGDPDDPFGLEPDQGGRELTPAEAAWLDEEEAEADSR